MSDRNDYYDQNRNDDYDSNVAQDAGYAAGAVGTTQLELLNQII